MSTAARATAAGAGTAWCSAAAGRCAGRSAAGSSLAESHALVAVGTGQPQVRLCDPNSGNVTHTLTGHREAVWATRWMRGSEWVLATGGNDGDVRLWDIRRAGTFMRLDASNARVGEVDALEEALAVPDRGFIPAGPAPATRRNVDSVPDHLFSDDATRCGGCLLYTSPSPRDATLSRMPSSA